jgi:hypothetical protein
MPLSTWRRAMPMLQFATLSPPRLALQSTELLRDRFWPMANPKLLADGNPISRPSDLAKYPFIHALWSDTNKHAPTWQRWLTIARRIDAAISAGMAANGLTFSEELHAIEGTLPTKGQFFMAPNGDARTTIINYTCAAKLLFRRQSRC